jgi:hypothetical protein
MNIGHYPSRGVVSYQPMIMTSSYMYYHKEEPAELNRDVALRALCPNSLFSKVVFSYTSCPRITHLLW